MKRKKLIALGMLACMGLSGCGKEAAPAVETQVDTQVQEESQTEDNKEEANITEEAVKSEESQTGQQTSQITITDQTENDVITAEDGKEIYRYDYSYPVVSIEGNEAASQEIAKDQEKRKTEFMEGTKINETSAKEMYDGVEGEEKEYFQEYEEYGYYGVERKDSKVISLTRTVWSYLGGAHGGSCTIGVNYDSTTGKILTLDDIFENKEEALQTIKSYILEQCEYPYYQERLFEDYEQYIDGVLAEEFWYLGKDGYHVISNEYMLGSYAAGEFEFIIPYSELTGLKEEYQPEGAYIYPVLQGASAEMDLDSDGEKEKICFSTEQNVSMMQDENGEEYEVFESPTYTLTINDQDMTEQFTEISEFHAESLNEYYYLVDLDESDDYIEIAICDYGSNDYNTTHIVRYDKGELKFVGYLQDMIGFSTCKMAGDGTLQAKVHSDMVETVSIECMYALVDDKLEVQEQEWYKIDTLNQSEKYQSHAILKEVTIYTEKDTASQPKVLTPSDGKVSFPATDNKEWVQVKMQDGTIYYLHMADTLEIDNAGTATDAREIFEDLLIAG